ncbi:unnamed protein product [Durusdinium trenchii]|uniref:Anoctamin transmembrane domain-containing protein n=1 Tax=Durusdinium trenchii TaxID=1381693 RepID=A0ABP0PFF4_9DINO
MRFNLTLVEEMLNFSRFCSWREIFSPNLPGLSRPFYFSGLRSFSTPLLMRVHVPHALFDGSANFHDAHGAMEERTSMENEPAEPAEPGPVDRVDTVQLEAPPAPEWAAADAEGPESQPEDVAAPVSPALSASPVLPEPPAAVPRQRAATGGAAAEGDGGDREVDVARKAKSSEEVDGRQAKKARNKGVKKKKKVAYGATEEPEEEAEEDVRPNVIGCPSEAIKVEIVADGVQGPISDRPARMPPYLPFHFRLDVSAIKIGKSFPEGWRHILKAKLEMEWRYCRKDQGRAWIAAEELPCEIRDAALQHQKSLEYVWTGIKERKEESWQCKETGQKTFPMRVIDFETIPGHSLRKEDLPETALHQGREEDVWCHMIYDLSTDPLLKEIGHEGPTKFSALMLLYISYLEGEKSKHATEIRIAHIDHFEFAFCLPRSPYSSCTLEEPEEGLARWFPADLENSRPLETLMAEARASLTWLFWDCFEELFPKETLTKKSTKRQTAFADRVKSLVYTNGTKDLRDCETRGEAMGALLSVVRAQAFQFPFRVLVREVEPEGLLPAIEKAANLAIQDYQDSMSNEGGLLPRQWANKSSPPLQLKEPKAGLKLLTELEVAPLQGPRLALIKCTGVIKVDRSELRHDEPEEEEHQADSGEAQETEQEEHPEEEGMIMTVDLSRWKEGELTVADLNIDDHQSIRETLTAVEYMEEVMREKDVPPVKGSQEDPRKDLKAKMAELAFGLRALQRASLKHQLRSVGLAVLETEREVATSSASAVVWSQAYQHFGRQEELSPSAEPEEKPVQRVLLLSAPELILRRRAEVRKLRRRVLPNKVNEEFLGGFKMEQFDQKGPLQKYWVETPQSSYPYRPFFQPPAPAVDPAALLSPAERKFLTRSFITDPLSEILGPGGTVDPRQGGANMDPRQLLTDGTIEHGLLHLHSHMSAIHLTNSFVYPWRSKGWRHYYLVSWCRCDTALVLHHFGPKIGSYFDFLETYVSFLLLASVLGIFAEISGPPNVHANSGFWKFVQPIFGVCMSIWGTFFCIFWRRRCAWLSHSWGNGWIEEGEDLRGPGDHRSGRRVRPEFALQWRQGFAKARPERQEDTLTMLKTLLRAPNSAHFDDRALTCDIMRFDEACYLSDWVQLYRFLVSYLASGAFILLASGATYGALAANKLLGLSGTTAGYAVTGFTTSVLVPLLNTIHYQVVVKTNNYQLFREDREREKDLFDRLFVFNLFNTYNSLLWIAFAERNMEQLRVQVLFLCLSSIFMNNLLEFFWSHFVKQFQKMNHRGSIGQGLRQTLRYMLVGDPLEEETKISLVDPIKTALDHVTDEITRDYAFELVDEAIELVIQYGLIMMFTVAFPLAPLLALINVHIEKRLDAYKLVKLMQSPEPRMVVGMGRAFNAFVIVTGLGLVVSGLLLYFPQYAGDACQNCTRGTSIELILPQATTEERLFLLGAGEHVLLIIMYACFTPASMGKDIIHEQYRQKFYENRLQTVQSVDSRRRTVQAMPSARG